MAARARGEKPAPVTEVKQEPVNHTRQTLFGALAVILALTLGIAADPSSVGFNFIGGLYGDRHGADHNAEGQGNLELPVYARYRAGSGG